MIGRTVAQYRVDARLGAGGMGVVYRAFDTRLQRTVALKVVNRQPAAGADDERVLEEARTASGLNHPNICTVYEVAEADGEAFIAMEYVAGRPLSQIVPEGGLPYEDVLRYATEIAAALAHAHERGIVHRDLKSANVVVAADGRAKVLDFGIARRLEVAAGADTASGQLDPRGAIPGTTAYIAPEVLLGDPADPRSDIWSLGVLTYEMAAGQMPFTGRNQFDLTSAILRAPAAPLPAHVPVPLRGIIQRCLAKDPVQRYQRAGEVRAALEAIQSDVSIPVPSAQERRPRGAYLVAAAIAAAALVGLAAWRFWPSPAPLADRLTQGAQLTQLLSSDRPAFDPAISPDGRMLVFAGADASGRTDLFLAHVGGGGNIRLTTDDAVESGPRFSPDGGRIAYSVGRRGSQVPEIRIVPALGGDAVGVIANAYSVAWSRDGRIAYLRQPEPGADMELVVARQDGGDARVVLRADSGYPFLRHPAWSPDGSEIAIVRGRGGISGEIWIVPAGGGEPRRLGDDPPAAYSEWPSYMPDGSGVLHASNRGGAKNIWIHPRAGGAPIRVTTGPGADDAPSIAHDGTIAFVNARWRNVLEVYAGRGEAPRVVTSHMPFLWGPAISPDGREVAFSRAEVDGSWHIWTVPMDGGAPKRITSSAAGEIYPKYTPDGRAILFSTWEAPKRIGRVERGGGRTEMLSFGAGTSDGFAELSPDGARIVFTRADADAERIYVAPAGGGEARLLTPTPGAVARWSPDGRRLAFGGTRGYRGGVFVIDADGRNERRLTAEGGWPVWWPGRGIGYLAPTPGGVQEIRIVDPAGGTPARLESVTFVGSNHPFDVSRTGEVMVTTNGVHVSDEIWLLRPRP